MQNLSELDADEQALMKRPRPIGWFVAGLVGIAAVGFVVASHLPLSAAHETLVAEHETLAKKAAELSHGLTDARVQLEKTEKDRVELRARIDDIDKAAAAETALFERAAATAQSQLDKFVKAKVVTIDSSAGHFSAGFDVTKLFVGAASKPNAAYIKALCSASESVTRRGDLTLEIVVPVAVADDAKAWTLAAERSAELAALVTKQCKLAPERVVASARSGATAVLLLVRHEQR